MGAPAAGEVEVSVFGPGFGECIVVHIGDGRWIIVDSCVRPSQAEPVALTYLRGLGVPSDKVDLLVATHWHDDHVRGFSSLLAAFPAARVCVSPVLTKEEFAAAILAADERPQTRFSSGVSEMRRVLELKKNSSLLRAFADRRIFRLEDTCLSHGQSVEVWTLSPCDHTFERFMAQIQEQLPREKAPKRRLAALSPNDCSVVVLVKIGELSILLGADLEEVGCGGWSAILGSAGRPTNRAAFFKVPHHGSENAHHPDVWRHLLIDKPLFALAPYNRGRKLPREKDVERLCELSPRGFATAPRSRAVARKRNPTVLKMIRDFNSTVSQIPVTVGQVRSRAPSPNASEFDEPALLDGAIALKHV